MQQTRDVCTSNLPADPFLPCNAEAVQQLEAAASAHAPPAVLQASRNLLPAPPSLTWRASIASSADAHTGDIVAVTDSHAQIHLHCPDQQLMTS